MKSRALACACIAVGALCCFAYGGSREYYADPVGGSDANDGLSAAKAFKTLMRATRALKAGDVLNLAPEAVFHESLVIVTSGTETAPIVIHGNGAVLSGMQPIDPGKWEALGDDLWFQPSDRCWGALRPRVFIGDEMISPVCGNPAKVDPAKLGPRTAIWQQKGVYFRAEKGKTPRDYALAGGIGASKGSHSGLIIDGKSYIVVDGLVAEHFPNDGFNIHGTCRGIVCRNIVARYNGDDGFSIHDDVLATVVGLHSHHNDFGIQDVGFAQTVVSGAVIEDNRFGGIDEFGGIRILRGIVVRGNGGPQMCFRRAIGARAKSSSPLAAATAYIEDVKVEGGGGEALVVEDGATVTAKDCTFSGTQRGCALRGGRVHMENCSASGCGTPSEISPKCTFTQAGCEGVQ